MIQVSVFIILYLFHFAFWLIIANLQVKILNICIISHRFSLFLDQRFWNIVPEFLFVLIGLLIVIFLVKINHLMAFSWFRPVFHVIPKLAFHLLIVQMKVVLKQFLLILTPFYLLFLHILSFIPQQIIFWQLVVSY